MLLSGGSEAGAFATLRLLHAMEVSRWPGMWRKLEESIESMFKKVYEKMETKEIKGILPSNIKSSKAPQELTGGDSHGGNSSRAAFASLHCAAAALIEDLGMMPTLVCGRGIAGEAACLTTAGILQPADGINLACRDCEKGFNSYWPPTLSVASAREGLLSEKPGVSYFNSLAEPGSTEKLQGFLTAVQSLQCDVVIELCIGTSMRSVLPSSNDSLNIVTARIGPPADGRIVPGDVVERAILEAAAALYSGGGVVNFAQALGTGHVSRLPPATLARKVCWPCDPAKAEWKRDDIYTDAYQASWVEEPSAASSISAGRFLISGGDSALKLAASLLHRGSIAKVGDPTAHQLDSPAISQFVFILESAQQSQNLQQVLGDARSAPHAMLQWLRSLPKSGCKAAIVSIGAHAADPNLRWMSAAAMWGAARSARRERSDLKLRCIDLDPEIDLSNGFKRVAEELLAHDEEVRDVLLCSNQRQVRILESLKLPLLRTPGAPSALIWPETFGVTGGTGALGLVLSEWLVLQGVRSLVLASRSGRVPDENAELWKVLSKTAATVRLCKCDVGQDPSPIAEMLKSAGNFGLAHLAGVLHDGLFAHQGWHSLDMTMKPKVDGAALLVDLLRSASFDHCAKGLKHLWLFSSVTSCVGNLGQTSYGAANSCLDSMSRSWWPGDSVGPTPQATLSLQWGPWADVGMASNLNDGSISIFRPWNGSQAVLALQATLGAKCPVVCLTQFSWPNVRQELGGEPYYQGFLKEVWRKNPNIDVVPQGQEVADHQTLPDLRTAVLHTLQKFLPNGLDGLTDDTEFDELGLDSLSGVEASRALGTALLRYGIVGVKPTFLFEANCLKTVLTKLQALGPPKTLITPKPAQPPTPPPKAADVKSVVEETLMRFLPNGSDGLTERVEFDELGLDSLSGVEASRALAAALAPLGISGIKPTFLFEANSLISVFDKLDKCFVLHLRQRLHVHQVLRFPSVLFNREHHHL